LKLVPIGQGLCQGVRPLPQLARGPGLRRHGAVARALIAANVEPHRLGHRLRTRRCPLVPDKAHELSPSLRHRRRPRPQPARAVGRRMRRRGARSSSITRRGSTTIDPARRSTSVLALVLAGCGPGRSTWTPPPAMPQEPPFARVPYQRFSRRRSAVAIALARMARVRVAGRLFEPADFRRPVA